MELAIQVENRYQMSPITLQYIDEANEQITIDSDMVLKKAVHTAYSLSPDKSKVVLRLKVGLPLNIEKTDLDLEMFKGARKEISSSGFLAPGESWCNLYKKDALMFNLHSSTSFSMGELDKIYQAFTKVTQKRMTHREMGYVTLPEFTEIMRFFF